MIATSTLLFALACTSGEDSASADPCTSGPSPEIEVGKGELSYSPMDEGGETIELIHGPQGGYHITIATRTRYMAAEGFLAGHLIGTIDGEVVGETWPYVDLRCNEAQGSQDGVGLLLVFAREPEELADQWVTVDLELTDMDGTEVSGTADVVIFDPNL